MFFNRVVSLFVLTAVVGSSAISEPTPPIDLNQEEQVMLLTIKEELAKEFGPKVAELPTVQVLGMMCYFCYNTTVMEMSLADDPNFYKSDNEEGNRNIRVGFCTFYLIVEYCEKELENRGYTKEEIKNFKDTVKKSALIDSKREPANAIAS